MKTINFLAVLIVSLAINTSCKKQPISTQNTSVSVMSAKINGVAWQNKPCTSCIGGGEAIVATLSDNGVFTLNGQQDKLYIGMSIGPILEVGHIKLNSILHRPVTVII